MPEFRKPFHRAIAGILAAMDSSFLQRAHCYFGGGTLVALALDEFRESRDIDFLCARREGFRELRETITDKSLGKIMRRNVPLAREVRADRDAIRTFFPVDDSRVKFEILLEARIELSGATDARLRVPVLDLKSMAAEKFLANADRGLDDSTRSRDLIDLAFLAARYGTVALEPGLDLAKTAYGSAVERHLALALQGFRSNARYAGECARSLGIVDLRPLRKGLSALAILAEQHRLAGTRRKQGRW